MKSSPIGVAVISSLPVTEVPVWIAGQAVMLEQESMVVDVDTVLAPEGVKTEYEVSQMLVVCIEQEFVELLELLDPVDRDPVEEAL